MTKDIAKELPSKILAAKEEVERSLGFLPMTREEVDDFVEFFKPARAIYLPGNRVLVVLVHVLKDWYKPSFGRRWGWKKVHVGIGKLELEFMLWRLEDQGLL